jgi:hypothetical protein
LTWQLARAKGEVSDEERVTLEARIKELRVECDDALALNKQLVSQCTVVKASLHKCTHERDALVKRLSELTGRIDEKLIGIDATEDALRKRTVEKEEAQVNHDILRLQVKRLRDALSTKSDEVFSLENRAAQMKLTIEARKREIEVSRTLARAEAKLAEEERHRLALDFADRSQKIAVLKVKYESLCARLRGSPDGEGGSGEPMSQAFFILQAAQKRELLQREGDELQMRITSCEKELKALAATLAYVNARNDTFREAFHEVDPGSNEASSVRALEAQVREATDSIAKRRRDTALMRNTTEEGQRRSIVLNDRIEELHSRLESLEVELAAANDEAAAAAADELSTTARLRDARRRLRSAFGLSDNDASTPDELAFAGQAARESAAGILFTLNQLASHVPNFEQTFTLLLKERGLRVPARVPGRQVGANASFNGAALALAAAEPSAPVRASSAAITREPPSSELPSTPFGGEARLRAPSPMVLSRQRPDAANTVGNSGQPSGARVGSVKAARPLKAPVKVATRSDAKPSGGGISLGVAGTSLQKKQ